MGNVSALTEAAEVTGGAALLPSRSPAVGVWLQYQTAAMLLQRSAFLLALRGLGGAGLHWDGGRRDQPGARRGSGTWGDIIKAICAIPGFNFYFLPLFEKKCVGAPGCCTQGRFL